MFFRVATLACLALPLSACAALRTEGDACTIPTKNDENPCPWGQACCVAPDCEGQCFGTCRARCPGEDPPAAECTEDSECNDDNPCTTDTCAESSCTNEPVDKGLECDTANGAGGHCTERIGSTDGVLICLTARGDLCFEDADCANDSCLCVDPDCALRECSLSQCSVCEFVHPIDGCTNMPDGAPAPECAPFVCNQEKPGGCLSTCDDNPDCAPGTRCIGQQCVDCTSTPGWCLMHRDREAIYKSVWALSPDDLWVVGQRHEAQEPRPTIFRWRHGRRFMVHQRETHGIFHDVWADATNVWAVGQVDLPSRLPLAVRWNGENWAQQPPLPAEDMGLRSVWSVGGVVFAVGTGGTVLRNGGFWERDWTTFRPTQSTILAVWGTSANAMRAGGFDFTDGDDFSAHLYEGSGIDNWTFDYQLGFAGTGVAVHDMWGTASGAIWAVGGLAPAPGVGGLPFVAARGAAGWDDTGPTFPLADVTLLGVWADDSHVWVVGSAPGRAGVYERIDTVWRSPHQIDWQIEPTAVTSSGGVVWVADELGSLFRYQPPPP